MPTATRIYRVQTPKGPRLVRAANVPAAIRHVAQSLITAEVATQDDLVRLVGSGITVEDSNAPEPAVVPATLPSSDPT